jgi:nucleoside-specific outer membrane channel protein Tsx
MKKIILAGMICMMVGAVSAGDLLQWQDNSLTLLYGNNFDLDPDTQETLTFEHVSGWSFGDLFIFVDATYWDGDKDFKDDDWSYYAEIAPRLSAGKILNKDLSLLFIKDFLIASCYETGKNSDESALVGPGVDLDIPGFDFLQLNLYRRFNDLSTSQESYQLTPVWKMTLPICKTAVVLDGFIDWVFGDSSRNLHICPQLKLDVGALVGMKAGSLYAGIEYDYWKNKYGVKNVDQSACSAIIKYHF